MSFPFSVLFRSTDFCETEIFSRTRAWSLSKDNFWSVVVCARCWQSLEGWLSNMVWRWVCNLKRKLQERVVTVVVSKWLWKTVAAFIWGLESWINIFVVTDSLLLLRVFLLLFCQSCLSLCRKKDNRLSHDSVEEEISCTGRRQEQR